MKLIFLEKTIFENVFLREQFRKCSLEQPVNNKGCSSIQFLLREFNQDYKKVFLGGGLESIFGDKKVPFPEIKEFSFRLDSLYFFELGLKSSPSNCIIY